MDRLYWDQRHQDELAMAGSAATAQSRLIHYDLAGRYSIKAALDAPFMLPSRGPATEGEREALRLPPLPIRRGAPERPGRAKPGAGRSTRR